MEVTDEMVRRASHQIWECMQNEGWIPTFGVRRENLPKLIETAARKALESALAPDPVSSR